MSLFPQSFIEDLKAHVDIVQVVQDHVPLKKAGSTYKGLCPFHAEKTPSFHVNRDRGFFHCFGCGVGGDVVKFVELQQRVRFPEAVRLLAQRFGLQVPEPEAPHDAAADAEREALLKIHELAAAYFCEQLETAAGARARAQLAERAIEPGTIAALQLGYAPSSRDALKQHLLSRGQRPELLLRSGLLGAREDGQTYDRFRDRLMIPICRESGAIVAFGGRALQPGQQPKYLNSPETAIYTKGRILYGGHLTRDAIRKAGYVVLVEGYFDFAQVYQAGVAPAVACCGTALSESQAHQLRRLTSKIVLSFDPDSAGQAAAARSGELLVSEGLQVNVAVLPPGEDPDTCVRRHGARQYLENLRTSRPFLEYLLDRAAARRDFARDADRRAFLNEMLTVASRIPDAAARDQFADRLAHRARITEEVVRAEIKKAAAGRRTRLEAEQLAAPPDITTAEKAVIWWVLRDPSSVLPDLAALEPEDLEGLRTAGMLQAARGLADWPAAVVPGAWLERLKEDEARLVQTIGALDAPPARAPADSVNELRRLRWLREDATIGLEIERLQRAGAPDDGEITRLGQRKIELRRRMEALGS